MSKCACEEGVLCGTCTRILMDDVRVISGQLGTFPFRTLLEELDITVAKMDAIRAMNVGPVTTGDDTQPMPYDEVASDAADVVKSYLRAVWGRMCHQYGHLTRGLTAEDIASSLLPLLPLLRDHEEVHSLARMLRHAVTVASEAIDRPSDRKYLGPCSGRIDGAVCGRSLYSDDRSAEVIVCRLCGTQTSVEGRRIDLLRRLEDCLCTTAQLEGMEWPSGATLTRAAIRGMKFEGKIRSWGKTPRGADLFRVGDITQLMMDRQSP